MDRRWVSILYEKSIHYCPNKNWYIGEMDRLWVLLLFEKIIAAWI